MAVSSKAYDYGRLFVGIPSSNPAKGMDVRLLCWLRCVSVAAFATR
jgi:hypothetical protein